MNEHRLTPAEFARRCGAAGKNPHTTASPWLSNYSLPGGHYLKGITTAFGVTSDWVLHGPPSPKYASSAWSADMLATELAAYVSREVAGALAYQPTDIEVDGARTLGGAVAAAVERCKEDIGRVGIAAPIIRERAIVATLLAALAARAIPSLNGGYDFVINAARSADERLARIAESVTNTAWTGPARINFERLRIASAPVKRVKMTDDERHVLDFTRPERRDANLNSLRENVLELITRSDDA